MVGYPRLKLLTQGTEPVGCRAPPPSFLDPAPDERHVRARLDAQLRDLQADTGVGVVFVPADAQACVLGQQVQATAGGLGQVAERRASCSPVSAVPRACQLVTAAIRASVSPSPSPSGTPATIESVILSRPTSWGDVSRHCPQARDRLGCWPRSACTMCGCARWTCS